MVGVMLYMVNPIPKQPLSQRLRSSAPYILKQRLCWQFRDDKGVWQDYKYIWSQLKPFAFRPHHALLEHNFSLLDSKPIFQVVMRYQPWVNKNLRIRYGKRYFRILQITDLDEAKLMHRLVVEEILNEYA